MQASEIKYKSLVKMLKANILDGKYNAECPLPSIQALMRRTGFSKNTVLHALDELQNQGLIARSQGRMSLVTRLGSSRKLGLIVPGVAYSGSFFSPMVSEIVRLAQENDYTLLLCDMRTDSRLIRSPREQVARIRAFAEKLVKERVAGVIYHPLELFPKVEKVNREIVAIFDQASIPLMLLDNDFVPPPGHSSYDVVGINDCAAGSRLAKHLIEQGARSIHFLMRPYWAVGCQNRLYGLMGGIFASGTPCDYGVLTAEPDDVAAVRRYLTKRRPDAFVCGNDMCAAALKQTLEGLGYRIPQDVMLAGFDDLQLASMLTPPLTTIRNPWLEIGRKSFEVLLWRMAHPDAPTVEVFLPAPLIVRASTLKNNSVKTKKNNSVKTKRSKR